MPFSWWLAHFFFHSLSHLYLPTTYLFVKTVQQKLDVVCNTVMLRAFCGSSTAIHSVASEEEDTPRCCADIMVRTNVCVLACVRACVCVSWMDAKASLVTNKHANTMPMVGQYSMPVVSFRFPIDIFFNRFHSCAFGSLWHARGRTHTSHSTHHTHSTHTHLHKQTKNDSAFSVGNYLAVVDPIDGSKNIDASLPVGNIFGIYKCPPGTTKITDESFLQTGGQLVAAGYCLFS